MIQHIWTVPCRIAITDHDTNNVSMIEVLEELDLAPFAADPDPRRSMLPTFIDVVTLWARERLEEPETGIGRVVLLSPQGETLLELGVEVDLRKDKRLRAIGRIIGFPMRGVGVYHFRIDRRANETADWQPVGKIPLEVSIEPKLEDAKTNMAEPGTR